MHVLGGLTTGIGVLAACHAGHDVSAAGGWLAYHTLTTAWAAGALAVLAIAWLKSRCTTWGWQWPLAANCSTRGPARLCKAG